MHPGPIALAPAKRVSIRPLELGAVLVDLQSGVCFELNRIGYEIWAMIERGMSEEGICNELSRRYPIDRRTLSIDVTSLIADLVRHGLVETISV